MAAITLLGAATFDTSSGSKTVTATPAVNDLIVIVAAHSGNSSAATPTDSQGGTYTAVNSAVKASSADRMGVFVRNSPIPSAVSTVFTHAPGTSTGGGLAVHKVTGMTRSGSSAVRQSAKQDNQAAATPAPVFGSAPLTTNPVLAALFNATNPATMTPRTNFTERVDAGYNTPASGLEVMSRDSGETATTQTWGSASGSAFCSLALELDSSLAPITGTLAKALGAATSSSAAKVAVSGVTSKTLGAISNAASGAVRIAGSSARMLGAIGASSAASIRVAGQAAKTLGAAIASAAAKAALRGQAARTLGDAASSSSARVEVAGQASKQLGGLSASSTAKVSLVAAAARTLGSMVATVAGRIRVGGSASPTLGGAQVTARGTAGSIGGQNPPPSSGVGISIGIGL